MHEHPLAFPTPLTVQDPLHFPLAPFIASTNSRVPGSDETKTQFGRFKATGRGMGVNMQGSNLRQVCQFEVSGYTFTAKVSVFEELTITLAPKSAGAAATLLTYLDIENQQCTFPAIEGGWAEADNVSESPYLAAFC